MFEEFQIAIDQNVVPIPVGATGFAAESLWQQVMANFARYIPDENLKALRDTSVTVVLIGTETANRKYVLYEIEQSFRRGHGLLGVYLHQLRDANGNTAQKGPNPLDKLTCPGTGSVLSSIFDTYDWVDHDGVTNLGRWVEAAARKRLPTFGTSPQRLSQAFSRSS